MENPQEQSPVHMVTDKEKTLGAIAYLGPLFILSFILAEGSPFVKFHAIQALVLYVVAAIVGMMFGSVMGFLFMSTYSPGMMFGGSWFMMLFNFAIFLVAIVAIIKAAQGEKWEIPGIGDIAKKINL